jgi:hypothetical protein
MRAGCPADAAGIGARGSPADCRRLADALFKTYPEYQRGSIDSPVRDLNHWDGVPRPPGHARLRRLFNKAVTRSSVDIVGHLIDAMQEGAVRRSAASPTSPIRCPSCWSAALPAARAITMG